MDDKISTKTAKFTSLKNLYVYSISNQNASFVIIDDVLYPFYDGDDNVQRENRSRLLFHCFIFTSLKDKQREFCI